MPEAGMPYYCAKGRLRHGGSLENMYAQRARIKRNPSAQNHSDAASPR
jgi:hypothetical protein